MQKPNEHPDELLPWYVNDTLGAEERAQVETHLAQCAQCRDEITLLETLQRQIQQHPSVVPSEIGLKRLMRDIKRERASGSERQWWRPAMAAAAIVIVVQSALLVGLWSQQQGNGITPLGGNGNTIQSTGTVLQLQFRPTATEAQIRELLNRIDATIVAGPGAAGVYRVQLATRPDAQALDTLLRELRERSELITHAAKD